MYIGFRIWYKKKKKKINYRIIKNIDNLPILVSEIMFFSTSEIFFGFVFDSFKPKNNTIYLDICKFYFFSLTTQQHYFYKMFFFT
jgi:hypothetical protein